MQLVDGGTADTLKNELSFGLRRGTVYWGKLCAALLLGLAFCLVLVGGSLAGGWLFLPRGEPEEALEGLALVGFCLAGALPIWCGMFALCHMLALAVRSPAAWTAGYYLMFFMGQPVLVFLAILLFGVYEASAPFTLFTAVVLPYSLLMPRAAGWLAHRPVPALVLGHRPGMDGGQHGAGAVSVWPERRSLGRRFPRADHVYTAGPALCGAGFVGPAALPAEAAYRLRALEDTGSTARVRLAVPNSAAEELLDEVNRLLELRQADRAAYQARERALRQQIANVSHDLRTPLTSILGYLQLLEDPGLTEGERREYLAVIAGRARTLQSLITSFYDLSRLEGGEYLLQREKVDLYASLSGLLAAFYNDFTDRGFDMEVELAEGLPQVWADAGAVLRIFTNLIRNALEHGEGRMEIRLYQEGGQVVSRFSNETHALTAEDVPHVFDRFFTSDKMRTGRNTGLGLAIVKALAGQMDCRAEAALEGDMFAITLRWPVERGNRLNAAV